MACVLGYWDMRALAEPLRFLLHYVGEDFQDKRYPVGPPYNFGPNQGPSEWLDDKFSLSLDFPNLPYYIDGDVKLTQTKAILRYLARKHGLASGSKEEHLQLDLLEEQMFDLFYPVLPKVLLFVKDIEAFRKEYSKSVPEKLKQLSCYLGSKKWLLGDRISYVDFVAYEALAIHRILQEDLIEPYSNLKEYLSRFESLDGIKDYMSSKDFQPPPWVQAEVPSSGI